MRVSPPPFLVSSGVKDDERVCSPTTSRLADIQSRYEWFEARDSSPSDSLVSGGERGEGGNSMSLSRARRGTLHDATQLLSRDGHILHSSLDAACIKGNEGDVSVGDL